MKKTFLGIIGTLILVALLTYAGDCLWVRYKTPSNRFSTVTIQPYYAIHQKNGRTEYDYAAPATEACVHSIFPHFGYTPCWYVKRHTDKRIDI